MSQLAMKLMSLNSGLTKNRLVLYIIIIISGKKNLLFKDKNSCALSHVSAEFLRILEIKLVNNIFNLCNLNLD